MEIKYNLKYGQPGLFLRIFYGKNFTNKSDILISKNYRKIFNFLDLDYNRWLQGFDELEDIFEFVLTSKYFNSNMFQLDQLNRINRERNLKRTSYMLFLDWITENHPIVEGVSEKNSLALINESFPEANLEMKIKELAYIEAKKAFINAKFNGSIIMKRYGLSGGDIGKAINGFREYINIIHDDFDNFILLTDLDYIYSSFERYLDKGIS